MSTQPRLARFGTFEFDLDTLELRKQGGRVPIEPQPARALAVLVQAGGEVVSRDALKLALWTGDVHVDFDRGLAYVMGQVRAALGDSADNPRFVETLPRRGFRFIAPLMPAQPLAVPRLAPEPPVPSLPPGPPASHSRRAVLAIGALMAVAIAIVAATFALSSRRPVLAVAIFDNETGQSQHDQFTSGMADAVIGHLANVGLDRLGVIGNARSLRMPRSDRDLTQIRTDTGATFILISVLQSQEKGIRLLSQLIRLEDGRHVWVKRFDRADGNLDGLEPEVLAAVESGVRVHMLGEAAPSPAAASR